jgi:glycosyltransferase involved in cell wall biosynthesis
MNKHVLVIQIPCFNEADTLAIALGALPTDVPGFDEVKFLVIDDGSSDDTAEVAMASGVTKVVRHTMNRGLAAAFMTGLETAVAMGATVIVNTDADNQYEARDIPLITQPIIDGKADMVIGARPIDDTEHFSWIKKKLQRLGSFAVRAASRTTVKDAPSGFRALSREAAMRINVFGAYTYTLETIIQAGLNDFVVESVPIRTNADLRPSRLVKSIGSYVRRSLGTIFRVFTIYRPLTIFLGAGTVSLLVGLAAGLRFLYFYLIGGGAGHVQSVVFAGLCLTLGTLMVMMGLIADLIAVNRKLLENVLLRVKRVEQSLDRAHAPLSAAQDREKRHQ